MYLALPLLGRLPLDPKECVPCWRVGKYGIVNEPASTEGPVNKCCAQFVQGLRNWFAFWPLVHRI